MKRVLRRLARQARDGDEREVLSTAASALMALSVPRPFRDLSVDDEEAELEATAARLEAEQRALPEGAVGAVNVMVIIAIIRGVLELIKLVKQLRS